MARPSTPPDWIALRREFVESAASLAQFARDHGIQPKTVQNRAKNEGWEISRTEHRQAIASRALKASENAAVRDAAAIRKRHNQIAGNIVVRVGQLVLEGNAKASDLNLLSQALQRASEVELVSGGHPLTPVKVEVDHSGSVGVGLVVLPELDKEP